jgi:protein TonB
LRSSYLTSLIAHTVFLGIIMLPALWTAKPLTTRVINVKLIAEEKPKPPAPAPKPEVVEEKKAPEPEKKAEPKMTYKPKKKTTTRKAEEKPRAAPEKKEKEPKKDAGSSQGPSVKVDDPDFRFAYYLEIIRERVGSNWSPPPVSGSGGSASSVIYFRISKSGGIGDTKVEKKSGHDLFDKAAVRAVKLCDPLPPLPAGYKSKWLGVHFEFEQTREQP